MMKHPRSIDMPELSELFWIGRGNDRLSFGERVIKLWDAQSERSNPDRLMSVKTSSGKEIIIESYWLVSRAEYVEFIAEKMTR